MNFAIHKIKPGKITTRAIKNNFKGTYGRFVTSDNAFSLKSSVKRTSEYWEHFSYDVLATVKQLGITTCFLTLSCCDLKLEELPNVIKKLNNLGLSDE